MQPANLATFPSVLIVLGSNSNGAPAAVFRMAPQHLFINMAWDHGAYCLSIVKDESEWHALGCPVWALAIIQFELWPLLKI